MQLIIAIFIDLGAQKDFETFKKFKFTSKLLSTKITIIEVHDKFIFERTFVYNDLSMVKFPIEDLQKSASKKSVFTSVIHFFCSNHT